MSEENTKPLAANTANPAPFNLEEFLKSQFEWLHGEMDDLKSRMTNLESRMDGLERQFESLRREMDSLKSRMTNLEVSLRAELVDRFLQLSRQIRELDQKVDVFIKEQIYIKDDIRELRAAHLPQN